MITMNNRMSLADRRAIKITQLTEKIEEANSIIREFVWPSDCDEKGRNTFMIRAAKFAGCQVPVFHEECGEAEVVSKK